VASEDAVVSLSSSNGFIQLGTSEHAAVAEASRTTAATRTRFFAANPPFMKFLRPRAPTRGAFAEPSGSYTGRRPQFQVKE
jgi:hypothetical protein